MTEIAAGTVIGGRYRLERRIGEGGMGVVWAAVDVVSGQRCAVKLVKPGFGAGEADAPRRFVREARAASAVRHPNVVRKLDVIELDDGSPVLVMELLDGESLRDLFARERRLAVGALAELMVPVVSAVGTAHALGIVHRDLKPENVFLARGAAGERVVKVLDFGIAKLTALDGDAMRSTGVTTGAVLGTPAYMAPEQVFAEADLDHRADVWALGLMLYQGLTGVLPTQADNVGQVLKNVLARPFEPIEQLVPDLPPELAQLITRMVSRERADRPADLREVMAVLERLTEARAPEFAPPSKPAAAEADQPTLPPGEVDALRTTQPGIALAGRPERPERRERRPARRPEPRPAPPRRSRRWLAALAALAAIGAAVAGWRRTRSPVPAPAPHALLAAPGAVLACPVLEAAGVDEPAGWLGAAAAATACERARVILGGRPERTLVPAELLGLPRRPVDGFPADPYATADARPRSLDAARRRATAYLDGAVTRHALGFRVALVLRAADGGELGRGEASEPGLHDAVRAAMAPLIRADRLPPAAQLDPELAGWARTRDPAAALALLDVNLAMAQNAGGVARECDRLAQQIARIGGLGPTWRWLCARTLGMAAPDVPLDASDGSPEATATRIWIEHVVRRIDPPGAADQVHRALERSTTSWGRSLLAAIESCLVQSTAPDRAYDLAIAAVTAEPKNPDGQPCDPWSQLMTVAQHRAIAGVATLAMQAWQPWSGLGLLMQGLAEPDPTAALAPLRRAHELSPFDSQIAGALADRLLAAGKRNDADRIARDQRAGANRVNQVEGALLGVRIAASEAQLAGALALARTTSELARDDSGWVRAERFEAAWRALELAGILGRARELADALVERFLDPEQPALDAAALPVQARVAALCALASPAVAPHCFARFRELRGRLSGAITPETDELLRGAERYAQRDAAGAARAWRPLLRNAPALAAVLPDAMVEVFTATGNPELAARVDDAVMLRAGEFGGATPGHARAARRALARGDRATARALADQVIAAWQFADETPPAFADMHRLLAQLGAR